MRSQIWSTHMYNILYIVYGMYTGRFTDKREGWAHQYHQLWLLLSAFGRNIPLQPFAAVLLWEQLLFILFLLFSTLFIVLHWIILQWEPSFVHPFSAVLNHVNMHYAMGQYEGLVSLFSTMGRIGWTFSNACIFSHSCALGTGVTTVDDAFNSFS